MRRALGTNRLDEGRHKRDEPTGVGFPCTLFVMSEGRRLRKGGLLSEIEIGVGKSLVVVKDAADVEGDGCRGACAGPPEEPLSVAVLHLIVAEANAVVEARWFLVRDEGRRGAETEEGTVDFEGVVGSLLLGRLR